MMLGKLMQYCVAYSLCKWCSRNVAAAYCLGYVQQVKGHTTQQVPYVMVHGCNFE